jgi:hypothetical protein
MAINPVQGAATAAAFIPPKKADANVANVNNNVNHPAVAPENNAGNNANIEHNAPKNAAPVQPQEGKSTVKQTINKFA